VNRILKDPNNDRIGAFAVLAVKRCLICSDASSRMKKINLFIHVFVSFGLNLRSGVNKQRLNLVPEHDIAHRPKPFTALSTPRSLTSNHRCFGCCGPLRSTQVYRVALTRSFCFPLQLPMVDSFWDIVYHIAAKLRGHPTSERGYSAVSEGPLCP
jgi:hypothetical protein